MAQLLELRPSSRELRAVVLSGACDELEPLSPDNYPHAHEALLDLLEAHGAAALDTFAPRRATGEHVAEWQALVRARNEVRFLGMHPTAHPMAILRREAAAHGAIVIGALGDSVGTAVRVAALVAAARRVRTRRGEVMQFVSIEDETGLVEAVLFPQACAMMGDPVRHPGPFMVEGRVSGSPGDHQLVVSRVWPFFQRPSPWSD